MMVGVWCKIASATYYAGTHQLPRITVDYDNGTTAYTQAATSTDWQFLPLPFTPTTTYGQITVTLSARTDATTTDAYVYWDDFVTIYPADTPLNTQTFDLFADALPVTPPLATVLSANDVWALATSTMTGAGTVGKMIVDIDTNVDDIETAVGTLPTAAAVADAVLDEAKGSHTGHIAKLKNASLLIDGEIIS
jgi:hypothetical protein